MGLRRPLLIGRTIDAVLGEDVAAGAVLETIRAAIAAGRAGGATVPVLRDDGQVLLVDVRVDIVDGGLGASERYVATLADVTERRQLEHALATVADEERLSFAREIREGLGQQLMVARASVSIAVAGCAADDPHLEMLLRAEGAIERATAMVRTITHGILPLQRGLPFVSALEAFADSVTVPGVVTVTVASQLEQQPIGNEADQLYRICQEAVTNSIRHSRARHVSIQLARREQGLEMRVVDDGLGFEVGDGSVGQGLRMMKLRASSVGGRLAVQSDAGQGTIVSCLLGN